MNAIIKQIMPAPGYTVTLRWWKGTDAESIDTRPAVGWALVDRDGGQTEVVPLFQIDAMVLTPFDLNDFPDVDYVGVVRREKVAEFLEIYGQ